MCAASEVIVVALCVAIAALLHTAASVIFVVAFALLYTIYNLFLWRTMKRNLTKVVSDEPSS